MRQSSVFSQSLDPATLSSAEPQLQPSDPLQVSDAVCAALAVQLRQFCLSHSQGALLQEMLLHHLQQPGKLLRPALILGLAEALGLSAEQVTGWALACEMLHNGSLVHDDLQDQDLMRRDQPSVWARFGPANAINAGNFFLLGGLQCLDPMPASAETRLLLCQRYSRMATEIVMGQSLEFSLRRHLALQGSQNLWAAYLTCIRNKTAALFAHAAAGVADILADQQHLGQTALQNILFGIFEQLGIVFQIQDDILDLYGQKGRGESGCDIREGKVSALVITLLQQRPALAEAVCEILDKPYTDTLVQDVQQMTDYFNEADVLLHLAADVKSRFAAIGAYLAQLEPAPQAPLHTLLQKIALRLLQPVAHLPSMQNLHIQVNA